ncbi:hypothetical protein EK21DRAFT_83925 [Setomelanomma holmii]|uniref:Uncharacterized protein n=1 Tax=Setomelanomma holmii TaxID=210430 RepID=A0A9P4HJ51_9PLEO|nr:hypothetical protein EK21DRAFT_83925 [Setomelanomma holmii]
MPDGGCETAPETFSECALEARQAIMTTPRIVNICEATEPSNTSGNDAWKVLVEVKRPHEPVKELLTAPATPDRSEAALPHGGPDTQESVISEHNIREPVENMSETSRRLRTSLPNTRTFTNSTTTVHTAADARSNRTSTQSYVQHDRGKLSASLHRPEPPKIPRSKTNRTSWGEITISNILGRY